MTGRRMAVVLPVLLAACAVPPKTPAVRLNEAVPLADSLQADPGEWPQARWWTRYHDPVLDQLVDQAVETAPAMTTAEARLRSARESVRVAAAANGLRVNAKADVSRQRLSDNGMFPPSFLGYHWYTQADHRRLDHRKSVPALDLLHQSAAWPARHRRRLDHFAQARIQTGTHTG